MSPSERLDVQVAPGPAKPLGEDLKLTEDERQELDQLVELASRKTGESPERCRGAVERRLFKSGARAVREELGA